MNNSELIIYTLKEPLYCCCFVGESLMACCSSAAVVLWDFAEGGMRGRYEFAGPLAPVFIVAVTKGDGSIDLLVQMKETKVLVLALDKQSFTLTLTSSYQLDMIGFTKLSIISFFYSPNHTVSSRIKDHFLTISYRNLIEKRHLSKGNLLQQYELDQTKIQAVSYLFTFEIEEKTHFLVVEEGGIFKRFIVPQESAILEVERQMVLPSKEEVKIVLSLQPMDHYLAYACMRNDNLFIINLKTLELVRSLGLKAFRLIKQIPLQRSIPLFALSNKSQICLLQGDVLISREKLDKSFILDLDTFPLGVIGVTEQGKILFLPIL